MRPTASTGGGLGEDERRPAHGPAAQVDEMPLAAKPSSHEYWHMGETAIRLRSVTPRNRYSEKRRLLIGPQGSGRGSGPKPASIARRRSGPPGCGPNRTHPPS